MRPPADFCLCWAKCARTSCRRHWVRSVVRGLSDGAYESLLDPIGATTGGDRDDSS